MIDSIVLVSDDDKRFSVSRTALIQHSPFFAGLFQIPTPASTENRTIEVPAPSTGLSIVLALIGRPDEGSTPRPCADIRHLDEALDVCLAFDFPRVLHILAQQHAACEGLDSMTAYALAALQGDDELCWKSIIRSLSLYSSDNIPQRVLQILELANIKYLRGLFTQLDVLPGRLERFQIFLALKVGMWDTLEGVTKKCRANVGCAVFRACQGCFGTARQIIAQQMIDIYKTGRYDSVLDVVPVAISGLDCNKCRRRFERTLEAGDFRYRDPIVPYFPA